MKKHKNKLKITVEVEVSGIYVNDGYFSIDYVATVDGKRKRKETYSSDFDNGMSDRLWQLELEKGDAVIYALQEVVESFDNV